MESAAVTRKAMIFWLLKLCLEMNLLQNDFSNKSLDAVNVKKKSLNQPHFWKLTKICLSKKVTSHRKLVASQQIIQLLIRFAVIKKN